jgi:hypothetical protein
MNAADLLVNQVDMDVVAQDFYFGGPGDSVEGLTVTPLGERFVRRARRRHPPVVRRRRSTSTTSGTFPGQLAGARGDGVHQR